MLEKELDKLNIATNAIAEDIRLIREKMIGKGISPADSPMIVYKLDYLERKLRQIGADKDNPIPFLNY